MFNENLKRNKYKIFFSILAEIGLRTIYFNFKYLPLKQAIKLPIFISKKVYLRNLGGKVIIETPVKTGMIKIGFSGVGIFDHKRSRSIWQVSGTVIFKGVAHIGHGSKVSVGADAKLTLGDNFTITAESSIITTKAIEFGRDCLLSWDVLVMDTDFHSILNENNEIINESKSIKIGDHVWMGCRALILKGSEVPSNSVIAANSLVSKALFGENKLFGGQPTIELKKNINWKL